MNSQIENKLKTLREKLRSFIDGNQFVNEIESELIKNTENKRLADNPLFKAIFTDAEKRITEINSLLLNVKVTEEERKYLFAQKDVWQFVFDRFDMKVYDEAIESLKSLIDSKLSQ